MLVDSHCHLDYADFAEEGLDAIVRRAQEAGVGHMLTISTQIAKFDAVKKVAEAYAFINCTVGTHPHHASEPGEMAVSKAELIELSKHPKVAGLGETGLDYHYNFSPPGEQQKSFIRHIEAAGETDLPLIIHTREADDDTMRLLRDAGQGRVRGVMHCFSGGQSLADAALEIGFYISFSGIVTFKKSEELRAVCKTVPLDRLLVETDSPYLAPMPFRGKRNEPAYVAHTAAVVAGLKDLRHAELADVTTKNFFTLFNRAKAAAV